MAPGLPLGAVQVPNGYDVAWKDPSSGLYTVWSTDSNGNYLANIIPAVPGNSTSLESLETTFQQDLNGDGSIGIPTEVIQIDGSTTLTEVGGNFYLYTNGSGPELQRGGAAVTAGELWHLDPHWCGSSSQWLRCRLERYGVQSLYGLEHQQ